MSMTKMKKPVTDTDPEAVESWDNEGGAPVSGDRSSVPKAPQNQSARTTRKKRPGQQEPCRVKAPTPAEGHDSPPRSARSYRD